MNRSLLNARRVLAALVVVLALSAVLPTSWAGVIAGVPVWVVNGTLKVATDPLTALSSWVRGPADLPPQMPEDLLARENFLILEAQILGLQQQLDEAREQLAELGSIAIEQRQSVLLLPARVVSAARDRTNPTMTINRGTAHGVEVGQVVVKGANLVGVVKQVDRTTANVLLVTAAETRMAVQLRDPDPRSGAPPLTASLRVDSGADRFLADIGVADAVATGYLAFLRDNAWPSEAAGYIVGQVVDVVRDPNDPIVRRIAVIQPRVDLRYATTVYVVTPKRSE